MTTEARTTVHRECDVCGERMTINLAALTLKMGSGIRVEIVSPSALCCPCFEKATKEWVKDFEQRLVSAYRTAKKEVEEPSYPEIVP